MSAHSRAHYTTDSVHTHNSSGDDCGTAGDQGPLRRWLTRNQKSFIFVLQPMAGLVQCS